MRLTQEIRWVLKGQPPEKIAMARLAEYMAQLAALFGEQDCVHFARVERGSTALVINIERGASLQTVQQRVSRVREGNAPNDAKRAYDEINAMVRADNGSAHLKFGQAVVLHFPGTKLLPANSVTMHDSGAIVGKLYAMFENSTGTVSARIRPRVGTNYIPCTVEPAVAKDLRGHLLEAVRVHGRGLWERSVDGDWTCKSFHIYQVHGVKNVTLRQAINELRAIDADWTDDPIGDWSKQNGAA